MFESFLEKPSRVKVISSTALKYRYLWCARSETPGQISQLIVLTRGKSFDTTAPWLNFAFLPYVTWESQPCITHYYFIVLWSLTWLRISIWLLSRLWQRLTTRPVPCPLLSHGCSCTLAGLIARLLMYRGVYTQHELQTRSSINWRVTLTVIVTSLHSYVSLLYCLDSLLIFHFLCS